MKLMCPEKRPSQLIILVLLAILVFSAGLQAQSKKALAAKKADIKKKQTQAKDARKDSRERSKKDARASKDSKRDKATAKARDKKKDAKLSAKEKLTAKDKARNKDKSRDKDAKDKKDSKKTAAARRAEAERRAAEEARRQAALAEQRRREQLAREARARRLAFERGLHTETENNIARDNTEGEDMNVRRAAVSALGSHAGTVVVMEAQTGKVLTIVNQDWAIRNSFKPCSTIKLVTGVGGINEKIINEEGGIGNSTSGLDLDAAIARSNNGYFQRVGVNMGSTKMISYAKALGLGEKTGINADGETAGRLPYGNNNARIYSHGDDFEVTPLQLAVMVSAIANGGNKVVPTIPRARTERTSFRPHITGHINLPQQNLQGVLPGMIGAAEYGTAHRGVDASMGVAGKTGSCIGKGSWVGLFASVAPVEEPKYSVVVITRGQGERGKYAAAVAGKIYQALGSQIHRNYEKSLALRGTRVKPAFDAKTAARMDEDEEEADETAAGDRTEAPIIVGSGQNRTVAAAPAVNEGDEAERPIVLRPVEPAFKKMVQKTAQSKPVLGSKVITFDRSGAERTDAAKQRPRVVRNK
jgi:penicillin-binding protein 2